MRSLVTKATEKKRKIDAIYSAAAFRRERVLLLAQLRQEKLNKYKRIFFQIFSNIFSFSIKDLKVSNVKICMLLIVHILIQVFPRSMHSLAVSVLDLSI